MKNKYSLKIEENNMAKAFARDISISTKMAVEVCNIIRNKELEQAKKILQDIISLKRPIPIRRYKRDLAHRKKIGPRRFPVKTSKKLLEILDEVGANAQFKGLDINNLVIAHIAAHQAARPWHFGRQRRRKMKRTHIEIVVKEKIEKKKSEKEDKKEEKPKEVIEKKAQKEEDVKKDKTNETKSVEKKEETKPKKEDKKKTKKIGKQTMKK